MLDRILLPEMQFTACHGVYPAEKTAPQSFTVCLTLGLDLRSAGQSDDVAQTVDYSQVYQGVRQILLGPPVNLIEHLAERIAQMALSYPGVKEVTVRLRKDGADMGGIKVPAAVEIYRQAGV